MKKIVVFIICMVFCMGCKDPDPRRPISVKSGSFTKTSVERNKKILKQEESLFKKLITKDTANQYLRSSNGYWYFYNKKADSTAYQLRIDDLVKITYDLRNISNDTIYTQNNIGELTVKVDKEELFPGLRTGIKLMREGEIVTFLFPSSMAYGYHGDTNKIGVNVPLVSTVKIVEVIERSQDTITN